jgi:hypothetical protein
MSIVGTMAAAQCIKESTLGYLDAGSLEMNSSPSPTDKRTLAVASYFMVGGYWATPHPQMDKALTLEAMHLAGKTVDKKVCYVDPEILPRV